MAFQEPDLVSTRAMMLGDEVLTVGAASSSGDSVERAVEKGDVGYALQVAFSGEGGWESGGDCGAVAGLVQLRDSSAVAAEIGADGCRNLGAGADS